MALIPAAQGEAEHGPTLLNQGLLPADAECIARPLFSGAQAHGRCGFRGRGLDFYQKPGGWFEVGVYDLGLRKCLEIKVDIYRS